MRYPKIRAVSAFPIDLSEGRFICLQDPHQYVTQPVVISPETFAVLQLFDGQHSYLDIQAAYNQQYGIVLDSRQIQELVEQCDQYLLLESPMFLAHLDRLRGEFARLPVRPPSHCGAAYPDDAAAILREFDSYFAASNDSRLSSMSKKNPAAILAPHIDIRAGGTAFASAYQALAASDATLFVILGTAHVEMTNFLALTHKSFETPLGCLETDEAFVTAIAEQLSYNPFDDELIHKSEHSIEFQVLFLQYLCARNLLTSPIKIAPILCGGAMHDMIARNRQIDETPQLEESIRGLQTVLNDYPNACIIAGVDFSHIGLRYGDAAEPNPAALAQVEQHDHQVISALEVSDYRAFATHIERSRNATQICGISPMYTLLRLIRNARGKCLHYDRTTTAPGSFVTFASMVWEKSANPLFN